MPCKYALKITCIIKKHVLGNSPSSASFAENVRPKQQNDFFRQNLISSTVLSIKQVQCMTLSHAALTPTPQSESVRFWRLLLRAELLTPTDLTPTPTPQPCLSRHNIFSIWASNQSGVIIMILINIFLTECHLLRDLSHFYEAFFFRCKPVQFDLFLTSLWRHRSKKNGQGCLYGCIYIIYHMSL